MPFVGDDMIIVMIHSYSFSFGLIFSFLTITHPSHIISLLTTLVFIIASFHPPLQTSMTHLCLLTILLYDSIAFYHVPIAWSSFRTFLSLRYINLQLATYFPKLDLLCTLVHNYTNLVFFSFFCLWLLESLHQCSELVTCPWNSSPTPRKSLGCIFEPLTLT